MLYFSSSDHYTLAKNSTVAISTDDIFHILPCELTPSSFPTFSFLAPADCRVKFKFLQFAFESPDDYMEIGDGFEPGKVTGLARFSGTELPIINGTSLSNAAWIKVKTLCRSKTFRLHMTISVENNTGIHVYIYTFSEYI